MKILFAMIFLVSLCLETFGSKDNLRSDNIYGEPRNGIYDEVGQILYPSNSNLNEEIQLIKVNYSSLLKGLNPSGGEIVERRRTYKFPEPTTKSSIQNYSKENNSTVSGEQQLTISGAEKTFLSLE